MRGMPAHALPAAIAAVVRAHVHGDGRRPRLHRDQSILSAEDLEQEAWIAYLEAEGASEEGRWRAVDAALKRAKEGHGPQAARLPRNADWRVVVRGADEGDQLVPHAEQHSEDWACEALAALPSDLRELAELKFLLGASHETVAAELDLSVATARRRAAVAKALLAAKMAELEDEGRLTRATGRQAWKMEVDAWAESDEEAAVVIPPGHELRLVRGRYEARRDEGPAPKLRIYWREPKLEGGGACVFQLDVIPKKKAA